MRSWLDGRAPSSFSLEVSCSSTWNGYGGDGEGTGTPTDRLSDLEPVCLRHGAEDWAYSTIADDGRHGVPVALVGGYSADLIALIAAATETYGDSSGMTYRIELVRPSADKPFAVLDVHRIGGMTFNDLQQPSWSRTVRRFIPVVGELPGVADSATWHDLGRQMAAEAGSTGHGYTRGREWL